MDSPASLGNFVHVYSLSQTTSRTVNLVIASDTGTRVYACVSRSRLEVVSVRLNCGSEGWDRRGPATAIDAVIDMHRRSTEPAAASSDSDAVPPSGRGKKCSKVFVGDSATVWCEESSSSSTPSSSTPASAAPAASSTPSDDKVIIVVDDWIDGGRGEILERVPQIQNDRVWDVREDFSLGRGEQLRLMSMTPADGPPSTPAAPPAPSSTATPAKIPDLQLKYVQARGASAFSPG